MRYTYTILVEKLEVSIHVEVKLNGVWAIICECVDSIHLAQSEYWRAFVYAVMNIGLHERRKFLDQMTEF